MILEVDLWHPYGHAHTYKHTCTLTGVGDRHTHIHTLKISCLYLGAVEMLPYSILTNSVQWFDENVGQKVHPPMSARTIIFTK